MKEEQPTRSPIDEEIARLRAELEQVRQERDAAREDAMTAIERAEAAEQSRERMREALGKLIETVEDSDIAHPCIDAVLVRARRAIEGE